MQVLATEARPSLLKRGKESRERLGVGARDLGRVRLVEECSGSDPRVGEVLFLKKDVRPEMHICSLEMKSDSASCESLSCWGLRRSFFSGWDE